MTPVAASIPCVNLTNLLYFENKTCAQFDRQPARCASSRVGRTRCIVLLGDRCRRDFNEDNLCGVTWAEREGSEVEDGEAIILRRFPGLNRTAHLCTASAEARALCAKRDVLVFGVFTGNSMRHIARFFNESAVAFRALWGFDSFTGLPDYKESAGRRYTREVRATWAAGRYSTATALGTASVDESLAKLAAKIGDRRTRFVRGFYNDSLTPGLARRVAPPIFVDMDCDIYQSTLEALDWMFTHGLAVHGPVPTVISYDDWGSGGPFGQQLAHRKTLKAHGAAAKLVEGHGKEGHHPEFEITHARQHAHAPSWGDRRLES